MSEFSYYDIHDKERHDFLVLKFREKFGEGDSWQKIEEIALLERSLEGFLHPSFSVREVIQFFLTDGSNWRDFLFEKDRQRSVVSYNATIAFRFEHSAIVLIACLVKVGLNDIEKSDVEHWREADAPKRDLSLLVANAVMRAEQIREGRPLDTPEPVRTLPNEANQGVPTMNVTPNTSVPEVIILNQQLRKLSGDAQYLVVARYLLEMLVKYVRERTNTPFWTSEHKGMVAFGRVIDFYQYLLASGNAPINLDIDQGKVLRWSGMKVVRDNTKVIFVSDSKSKARLLYIDVTFFERATGRKIIPIPLPTFKQQSESVPRTFAPKRTEVAISKEAPSSVKSIQFLMDVINGVAKQEDLNLLEKALSEREGTLKEDLERVSRRKGDLETQIRLIETLHELILRSNFGG